MLLAPGFIFLSTTIGILTPPIEIRQNHELNDLGIDLGLDGIFTS
jgi:hypothetical protein